MSKRRLAVLTALALVVSIFPTVLVSADTGFDDVSDDHVFAADIEWLAAEGITLGCNPPQNTRFCPDESVTRGQMAAFLVRALDLTAEGPSFDDTAGHVFERDISRLAAARITLGCNPPQNTRFCPDEDITRGAMAAFLVRALNLTEDGPSFDDTAGHIFERDISRLAAARITLGCNPPQNTRFCPDDPVTRGAMAAFLHRALETEDKPDTPDGDFEPFTISGGEGVSVHEFRIPNDYWALVDVTHDFPVDPEVGGNIIVQLYTEDEEYDGTIVNEIGFYEGRRQVNQRSTNWEAVHYLRVDAAGPWEITARPLSAAERFSTSLTGSGDDIVVYTGSGSTLDWSFDTNDNFQVHGYDKFGIFNEYIVNEIGPATGTAPFDEKSVVWDITGFGGEWSLDTR